jgi:hypothetical protein
MPHSQWLKLQKVFALAFRLIFVLIGMILLAVVGIATISAGASGIGHVEPLVVFAIPALTLGIALLQRGVRTS